MELAEIGDLITRNPGKILNLLDKKEEQHIIKALWNFAGDERESKSVRKAAKKTLYIIKSRGIDVDRYKPEQESVKRSGKPEKTIHSAMLSIPDSEGNNLLVFILVNTQTQGFDFLRFVINSDRGIQKYSSNHASKKVFETFKAQNPVFFPVAPEYGLMRLNRALKKTEIKKISGLSTLPDILVLKDERETRHPVLDLVPVKISRIITPEEEKDIFKMREVGGLSLFGREVEGFKREIETARNSKLILMGRTPEERVGDIISRIYYSYFIPARRAFYSEMLLDIALYFFHRKSADYSRILIDWSNRLKNVNQSAKEHPFLNYLVYKEFLYE